MADKEKPKKSRIVKNPESFRQKAAKASEQADKPTKRSKALGAGKTPFAFIAKFFRAIFSALGKFKVFRAIGYIVWPVYFRNSVKELKDVTWPTWKQSVKLTWAVLVFAIIFGVIVAVVDYGLDKLFRKILLG